MNKKISFFIALILSTQIGNSQENMFSMTLTPEASWTNKLLHLSCLIQNSSNKVVKVIPIAQDCNNKYYPLFWKIRVKRNDIEYDTDTLVLLGEPPFNELIKIHSGTQYRFNFCIDFSELIPINIVNGNKQMINIKEESQIHKNLEYGLYTIQIEYLSNLKIKKQLGHLISNEISIIYK